MIKCKECAREYQGDPMTKGHIFVCRFCMGDGIDPRKYVKPLPSAMVDEIITSLDRVMDEKRLEHSGCSDRNTRKKTEHIKEIREIVGSLLQKIKDYRK